MMHLVATYGLSLIVLVLSGIGALIGMGIAAWKGVRPGILACLAAGAVIAVLLLFIVIGWSHTGVVKPEGAMTSYFVLLANVLPVWLPISMVGVAAGYGIAWVIARVKRT